MKYVIYLRKSSESEDKQLLSLSDQQKEIERHVAGRGLEIVGVYPESKSARYAHARPIFNDILRRIQSGEVEGIVCWKANRLARNNEEGGLITDLLSNGQLKHIITVKDGEFFPHTPQMMLAFHFAVSSQYSRDLSVDTKRGHATKVEMGYRPCRVPYGYKNDPYGKEGEKKIYPDPKTFDAFKSFLETVADSNYSVREAHRLAKSLPKPISFSTLYRAMRNPFYYGQIKWGDKLVTGKHSPMISKETFLRLQALISSSEKQLSRHSFPYLRTVRCGECGAYITAETHTKRNRTYVYYRCTKRVDPNCSQKAITGLEMARYMERFRKRGILTLMKTGGVELRLTNGRIRPVSNPFHVCAHLKQVRNLFTSWQLVRRGVNER